MRNIVIGIAFLLFCSIMNAQEKKWDYPIKPGTSEWNSLTTYQERLDKIQIPDAVLKSLSTKDLVDICMDYPFTVAIYSFNTINEGLKNSTILFNGFRELLTRKDNYKYLKEYLDDINLVTEISQRDVSSVGYSIVKATIAEGFLAFDDVLQNADIQQKKDLSSKISQLVKFKKDKPQYFSNMSLTASALILSKVIFQLDKSLNRTRDLKLFMDEDKVVNEQIVEEIELLYNKLK